MRILWVVNVKLPIIYEVQNEQNRINAGGWLDRISRGVLDNLENEVMICYPCKAEETGNVKNLSFYGIDYNYRRMQLCSIPDRMGIILAKQIILNFHPDIIHIHGTEYQYHWFFSKAATDLGMSSKLITSIQGLVGIYAEHYALKLPSGVIRNCTVKEFVQRNNIRNGIKNFLRRGAYEEKTIKLTNHIIGRTTWDRACTYRINPTATYHIGNETLREEFYTGDWKPQDMIKHRIFISQASYPVKGFHLFLEALADIIKFFPDVTVHVAGSDITRGGMINGSSYGIYIKKRMEKMNLGSCIHFCGSLNAQQMKEEMLAANVFVSPSTIENSPNSVGEAMLLGVPVVSSNVGGMSDLLVHGKEGFLYQSDAPYMLAYYVNKIFGDDELASDLGKAAHERAKVTHDYEKNLNTLLNIYGMIVEDNKDEHTSVIS